MTSNIDVVILIQSWRERAQKARDEAHDNIDWDNPGTAPNRLLIASKVLDDCAKELEIVYNKVNT